MFVIRDAHATLVKSLRRTVAGVADATSTQQVFTGAIGQHILSFVCLVDPSIHTRFRPALVSTQSTHYTHYTHHPSPTTSTTPHHTHYLSMHPTHFQGLVWSIIRFGHGATSLVAIRGGFNTLFCTVLSLISFSLLSHHQYCRPKTPFRNIQSTSRVSPMLSSKSSSTTMRRPASVVFCNQYEIIIISLDLSRSLSISLSRAPSSFHRCAISPLCNSTGFTDMVCDGGAHGNLGQHQRSNNIVLC
jgi:hypothetical protein